MEGDRRLSLSEQMSAIEERRNSFTGLTVDAILGGEKRPEPTTTTTTPQQPQTPPLAHSSRTLLDIIRDEEPHKGQRDKKSWKTFRDRLRLKRAGAAWTSSVHIPASDIIPVNNNNNNPISPYSGRNSHVRFVTPSFNSSDSADFMETVPVSDPPLQISRPVMTRRGSTRFVSTQSDDSADIPMPSDAPPPHSFRPQISRHNSTRYTPSESTRVDDVAEPAREGSRRLAAVLAEERALSAREAVAAQEAAEAEAAAAAEREAENAERNAEAGQPVRMSLMDLLEETDRQMGVVGSRYMMGDDDEVYDDDEEYDDDEGVEQVSGGGVECTCCVCMVRHKGAAFIPCGHTFCRLCSRELWVQRGNCPLCNGFILEILDIF